MIEQFVNYLTGQMISRGISKKGEVQIIRYGLQMMVEVTLIVLSISAIAVIMDQIREAAAWMGTVVIIRSLEGGKHAKTFRQCYLITVGTFVASMLVVLGMSSSRGVQLSCWIGLMVVLFLYVLVFKRRSRSKITAGYVLVMFVLLSFQVADRFILASLIGMIAAQTSRYVKRKEYHP